MSTSFPPGVVVTAVEVSSEAWGLGLRPGDRITTTAGLAVEDCLAVTFSLSSASGPVAVTTHGQGGHRIITVEDPEGLLHDIRMEAITPQRCSNDCVYCFCKQNPPQARPSLLFRDEDHRMSFLTGAYVTLSALTDAELARIIRDRLSPLYVTVPATDEALRRRMLGVRVARPLLETLRTMVSAGITVHTQIVVCPGLNDGDALERSLADLDILRPGVASVALVPVGTTRYTPEARIRRPNPDELRHLLAVARRWSAVSSATEWVQASDEVYLALGRPVPSLQRYGEFPQLLTGVGMVRRFLEDAARIRRRAAPAWWQAHRIALITGTLFSPVLSRVVQALNLRWGARASVVAVENQYFGQYVTVAGLLGGREIRGSLRGLSVDVAILPGDALAAETLCFIDDMEFAELEDAA
ncbi:DUF512 domain-containing protein, partial [Candidatus Fermentibacteria bacterium]|nr:DUF512 domain-containing protein [Candidatus Fermentibacteria bacterium]